MVSPATPTLDTSKAIEWQDASESGKFTGSKKVTAKIDGTTKSYTITIRNANSKEEGEALLQQKIHEVVSVALMVNVNESKSLVYKDGSYSTVTKSGDDTVSKKISYLDGGYSNGAVKQRTEKAENRHSFYEAILPILKGRNSDIDETVQNKIKNKEPLSHEDLKKIDSELKVDYFHDDTDISDLTADIVEQKIQKWKQAKALAELSMKIFNLQDGDKVDDDSDDDQEPTALELAQQGYNLLIGAKGKKDEAKGIELLEQGAEKGEPQAHFILARHYFDEKNNVNKALEHGLKAADANIVRAQDLCADIYRAQKDLVKEHEMLQKAVAQNSPIAHYYLALHYKDGTGIKQDADKAKEHFELAIQHIKNPLYRDYNQESFTAQVYFNMGEKEKAKETLENAGDDNALAKKLLAKWFPVIEVIDSDDD